MEKEKYFNSNRNEMIEFLPTEINRSIEFGCGFGNFSGYIKETYQAETWGVDINPIAIEKSQKVLDKVINCNGISAIELLPNNFFDCVICNDFLEHLDYPDKFLSLIRKKIAKNSYLIASIPNVRYWTNSKNFLLRKDWKYTDEGILDYTHLRFFTEKSLICFIKENNLELEKIKGINGLNSFRIDFLNFITCGLVSDMKYLQFGIRAKFIV